ncbi:MAG: hypothetical protein GF372_09915 [Candidatus Marinimicrobia bacterium]|nr:hypothetical protein [Candidatus Neomarinimicrobiota bacterium]
MPQLAAWEKVFIDPEAFPEFHETSHGELACTDCHDGNGELVGENSQENMETAHANLIHDPSSPEVFDETCGFCHRDITENNKTSMHTNLWGEKNFVAERILPGDQGPFDAFNSLPPETHEGYEEDCGKCHTTCGQCHVSRPNSVEGGFVNNHMFQKRPDQSLNCTACHGSRVGEEYTSEGRSAQRDVHYIPGAMHCVDCHDATEMHGDGNKYPHRLANPLVPRCEDCHSGAEFDTANDYHDTHLGDMSCTVCHSQEYKSCNSCHVGEGIVEPSYIDFKIGLNPVPDDREYKYVTVRHIPISRATYEGWGQEMQDYTALPTWKYTVPHNIRRWTARTDTTGGKSCAESCHIAGQTDSESRSYFLLQDSLEAQFPADTYPGEIEANQPVVVDDALPAGWLQ